MKPAALVDMLEWRDLLPEQGVLAMIQERRQREPMAISPRRHSLISLLLGNVMR